MKTGFSHFGAITPGGGRSAIAACPGSKSQKRIAAGRQGTFPRQSRETKRRQKKQGTACLPAGRSQTAGQFVMPPGGTRTDENGFVLDELQDSPMHGLRAARWLGRFASVPRAQDCHPTNRRKTPSMRPPREPCRRRPGAILKAVPRRQKPGNGGAGAQGAKRRWGFSFDLPARNSIILTSTIVSVARDCSGGPRKREEELTHGPIEEQWRVTDGGLEAVVATASRQRVNRNQQNKKSLQGVEQAMLLIRIQAGVRA